MAAKPPTRKTATKRPAPPPAPTANGSDATEFEPPRLTTSDQPADRVVLFYIDDRPYSIELKPGVNVGLKYLHLVRTAGESQAQAYLLEKLLGAEGYEALMEYDDLTQEQFQRVVDIASSLTLGALEPPKA